MSSHIHLHSGGIFDPLDPDPAKIVADDIAHALSLQCRFSGHCETFYSVAEHSLRVSWLAPEERLDLKLWCLLHDAQEAYLQDVASPLKHDPSFGGTYHAAEERLQGAIAEKFDLQLPVPEEVKAWDRTLLATERRDLMPRSETVEEEELWAPWIGDTEPLDDPIRPLPPPVAKMAFLHELATILTCRAMEEQ